MLKSALLSASLLALAGAANAAGYGVSTSASLWDSDADYVIRGYNPDSATNFTTYLGRGGFEIGDGSGTPAHPVGDSGLRYCTVFNCSLSPYPVASSSGTTDTSGTAASAFDALSGQDDDGPASASASAYLATGSIHATAAGSFGRVYGGEDQYSAGYGVGVIGDTLHFTVAGASADTLTTIQVELQIDGLETTTRTDPYGYQGGYTAYLLALGSTVVQDQSAWNPGTTSHPFPTYLNQSVNDGYGNLTVASLETVSYAPEDTDLIITYDLKGASVDAGFAEYFGVGCQDGVSCDFSDTARVSFLLPRGVTFTSDSGVFLTAMGGVPEPASWAMMLAGAGLLGAALRRRRLARA